MNPTPRIEASARHANSAYNVTQIDRSGIDILNRSRACYKSRGRDDELARYPGASPGLYSADSSGSLAGRTNGSNIEPRRRLGRAMRLCSITANPFSVPPVDLSVVSPLQTTAAVQS